jgi:C-lobe and N-lobe beta barrels of Tf-binding protein B
MNHVQLKAAVAALLASAALAGTAQAQVTGASNNTQVTIGASTVNGGPHASGRVGIHVPALQASQSIDFQGLQTSIGTDANGVSTYVNTTSATTDHSKYGRFDFAKVSTHDVYFGEWSQTGSATAGDHTVYYGGTGASSALPSSGTATYSMKGISDYQNNGILTGTFTADFGNQEVTGSIQSASGYKLDIGSADIIGTTISGNGAVASQGTTTLASNGAVSGQFFGTNGSALAGIATFSGARQYDTAFGGTKN